MIIDMNRRGFTIVELLIVITIMGILLVLGVANLRSSQISARDSERKTDIDSIALHLDTYYTSGSDYSTTFGKYPSTTLTSLSPALSTGMVGYCKLDETSGTTAYDSLGLHNGTITGSTVNQAGKLNTSYLFNGTSNYVYLPIGLAINTATSGYTISTWIYAQSKASAGSWSGLVMDWVSGGKNNAVFGLSISNGTTPTNIGAWTGGNQGTSVSVGTLTTGWHHVVGVWTAGTTFVPVRMYFDGNYVGNSVTDRSASWSGTVDFGLGTTYTGYDTFFKGSMDEVGIWNRTLTDQEVSSMYNAGNGSQYPFIVNNETGASIRQTLRDIDDKSITAPGITDPSQTFISATNNMQTTAGVLPQPTINQYVYQPLQSDGSLCTSELQECRKFNLYYRLEADNTVYMLTGKNQ